MLPLFEAAVYVNVSTLGFEIEVATCVMSEGMEHYAIGMTT